MFSFTPTIILRHRRENLNKCSLKGLETRSDMLFFPYPNPPPLVLSGYLMLTLDAPPLTREDASYGILLLDATWRYACVMARNLPNASQLIHRSLPSSLQTAYPRRQLDCPDPERGLASIEALYSAYAILGRDTTGLLDNYHWRESFLEKNTLYL